MQINEIITEEGLNEAGGFKTTIAAGLIAALLSTPAQSQEVNQAQDYLKSQVTDMDKELYQQGQNMLETLQKIFRKKLESDPKLRKNFEKIFKMLPPKVRQEMHDKMQKVVPQKPQHTTPI